MQKTKQGWSTGSVLTMFSLSAILLAAFLALSSQLSQHFCPPGSQYWPQYDRTQLGTAIRLSDGSMVYDIVVVTDLDHDSKHKTVKNTWYSHLKRGALTINQERSSASVVWIEDPVISVHSQLAAGGRSMELSDLAVFDGHLVSIDDRTGIVYRINGSEAIPWILLNDGPGNVAKGFKGEWMAVKDDLLYVGGLGKEWTTTEGVFVNHNPMWIKTITHTGYVRHIEWVEQYKKLRAAFGIHYPGYMIHESAQYSQIHRRWFFLPRRASHETYTETADEHRGTNVMLIANDDFDQIEARTIGILTPERGYSAFMFVPDSNDDLIVALKSEEKDGVPMASYITVFHVDGRILMDETPLKGAHKFEGIAFV